MKNRASRKMKNFCLMKNEEMKDEEFAASNENSSFSRETGILHSGMPAMWQYLNRWQCSPAVPLKGDDCFSKEETDVSLRGNSCFP